MHETQCQDQMWKYDILPMLATIWNGEQLQGLTRYWSSGNSDGCLREFADNKICLPGNVQNPQSE